MEDNPSKTVHGGNNRSDDNSYLHFIFIVLKVY